MLILSQCLESAYEIKNMFTAYLEGFSTKRGMTFSFFGFLFLFLCLYYANKEGDDVMRFATKMVKY